MTLLAEHADVVIYDSPPLGTVTDAAILAARSDGALQVVRAGQARPNIILGVKSILDMVGARMLGPVLNRVRPSDLGYASLHYPLHTRSNGRVQPPKTRVGND
jgi:Mrp family chromosome partitioning ATPase